MINLLRKELYLAIHPTNWIFLSLSAMLLIPAYPLEVIFFYTMLGLFFLCLNGRENHDIEYSMTLPIRKSSIVHARIGFAVLIELTQLLLAIPFAVLRQKLMPDGNAVGMDANIAFFGLSLLLFGLFNVLFFTSYYKSPAKIGKAFIWSSAVVFLFITVEIVLDHTLPFLRDQLDTPDPQYLGAKLAALSVGALGFILLSWIADRVSARHIMALDL